MSNNTYLDQTPLLRNLNAQRIRAVHAARGHAERAANGEQLSAADTAAYEKANADIERLSRLIRDEIRNIEEDRAYEDAWRDGLAKLHNARSSAVDYGEARWNRPLMRGQSFVDLAAADTGTKRTVEESGEYLRWLMGGPETRVGMTTGTAPGSNVVPLELLAPLMDLARSKMVASALGCSIVPMSAGSVGVPVHSGDPVASFRSELGVVAETGVTLDKVTLNAKSLDALIRFSIELAQDSEVSIEAYLAEVFAEAFARKLDSVMLFGSGVAPEPQGVYGASGVTKTPLDANGIVPTDYDYMIDLVARLRGKNIDPSLVLSPRTEATMGKITEGISGSKSKLPPPPYLADVPILRSNQVKNDLVEGTSGATCSAVFGGRWSSVLLGIRAELRLDLLQERYRDTGEFAVVAHMRGDIQIARPGDLEIVSGIKAA